MHVSCESDNDQLKIYLSPYKGNYPAWWKEVALEAYGWTPRKNLLQRADASGSSTLGQSGNAITAAIPDHRKGVELTLQ